VRSRHYEVAPRAGRLTGSLRDVGYDFASAIADLVDNSVTAGASKIDVEIVFDGPESYVLVADNGCGLTGRELNEALRFGSMSTYSRGDLGRFGLGLKTASLSQCRLLTVASRANPNGGRIATRTLDLDLIEETDEWVIYSDRASSAFDLCRSRLRGSRGTVVVWEALDRVLNEKQANNGWGRRRLGHLAQKTAQHLGMVFHRFLSGELGSSIELSVNGEAVTPWDPFARSENATEVLDPVSLEIHNGQELTTVELSRYVLPPRKSFSNEELFDRLSGPLKWNRQQGLYVYRAGRLVQGGGWCGLRGIDEHTKLARASLEFNTDLDDIFQINVAKMRINLPSGVRQMLERPVHELCILANDIYRRHAQPPVSDRKNISLDLTDVGLAIRSAALEAGQLPAISQIEAILHARSPDVSRALGFSPG
jgi:hypothetical protein